MIQAIKEVFHGRQKLDFIALGLLTVIAITFLYAIIYIHDILRYISTLFKSNQVESASTNRFLPS